jgi:uncharacterized membrane protein
MIRRLLLALCSPVVFLSPLVFLSADTAFAVSTPPLVVEGVGNATVQLDGTWQFHLGDDPAWASPSLDDSGWESISVDRPWGAQQHFNYTGYAWYRRHINFVPVAGANSDLALTLPLVDSVYTLYWNGREIGTLGKMPPHPVWPYRVPNPEFLLGKPEPGVLAVRVWMAPYTSFGTGEMGGLTGPPLVGSTDAISAWIAQQNYLWLRNAQYNFILNFLYGVVALLGFLSWIRNRNQPVVFWMAVFAVDHVIQFFLVGFRLPLSFNMALGWLQPVLSLEDISLWFLLLHLLELNTNRRLWRLVQLSAIISLIATSADGLLSAADWSGNFAGPIQTGDFLFTAIFTVLEIWPLILIAFALHKRLSAARWMVAIFASLTQMIFVVRVAASQGSRFTHWTWGEKITAPLFRVNGNPFTVSTLSATLLLISIVYAVYRYSAEQNERQAALEQEYRSAQELQRVLIPETLPPLPGFAVTSAYVPAQEVGGDFFQVVPQPDGSALLALGDVSGKGLKAAMTVSLIVGTLRTLVEVMDDPAEILNGLNRRLQGRLKNGFVTCLILRLDANGNATVANAGHLSPFLNADEIDLPGDLPLGVVPTTHYENTFVQLEIGDRLTLYTDGLVEARDASGEIFSFARLKELIATKPDAAKAAEAAVAFGPQDDITVLTITRLATGVESTISLTAPELVGAGR